MDQEGSQLGELQPGSTLGRIQTETDLSTARGAETKSCTHSLGLNGGEGEEMELEDRREASEDDKVKSSVAPLVIAGVARATHPCLGQIFARARVSKGKIRI